MLLGDQKRDDQQRVEAGHADDRSVESLKTPVQRVLDLHGSIGNRAVRRLIKQGRITPQGRVTGKSVVQLQESSYFAQAAVQAEAGSEEQVNTEVTSDDPKVLGAHLTSTIETCYTVYLKRTAMPTPVFGVPPGAFAPAFAMIGGKSKDALIAIFRNVDPHWLNILQQFQREAPASDQAALTAAFTIALTPFLHPENMSGAQWRKRADAAGWSNSTSIDDLSSDFKPKVLAFKAALDAAGTSIVIGTTRRSEVRAWLMHYAWVIAYGGEPPQDDPHQTGIVWDHGDPKKTKDAARAMKDAFAMAHIAVLNSHHIEGNAIDWTITWTGDLTIKKQNGESVTITTEPRHGGMKGATLPYGNTDLHAVGATYGVKKLYSDEPHWSLTGG